MAVIDNGEGMPEGFLIKACQIAGTHRASSNSPHLRKGYGRFGHGLPKASISQTEVLLYIQNRKIQTGEN